jgi:3-polyprenyl-4-hydroxybenzoate decarboxylase
VTIVDSAVIIRDPHDVEWAMATRFQPDRDIILIRDARGHELNPVTDAGIGCKIVSMPLLLLTGRKNSIDSGWEKSIMDSTTFLLVMSLSLVRTGIPRY